MVQFVFPAKNGGPMCDDDFRSRVFYNLIEMADVLLDQLSLNNPPIDLLPTCTEEVALLLASSIILD